MKRNEILNKSKLFVLLSFIFMITLGIIYGVVYVNASNINDNNAKLLSDVNTTIVDKKDESYESFIAKYNDFSSKISSELLKDNCVVSPYSVFSNLILMYAITDNNSKTELLNALDMTESEITKNYQYFYGKHNYVNKAEDEVITQEKTYNSLWIQNNLSVNNNIISKLANSYYCNSYYIDFTKGYQANETITKYVKQNTNGVIDTNFNISKDTLLSIINVNYLKDIWGSNDLRKSGIKDFKNSDNSIISKPFNESFYFLGKIAEEDNYSHFYTETYRYRIKFILPNENIDIRNILTSDVITKVNNYKYTTVINNKSYNTRCIFPNFKLESDLISLSDILINKFGINDIFNQSKCDLSLLNDKTAVLSEIKHKSVLDVNEKGIEGAAVTLGAMYGSSDPNQYQKIYEDFLINKSFGIIVSNLDNEIIYTGIIDKI